MAPQAGGGILQTLISLLTEERHLLDICQLLLTAKYLPEP
jgi:hypothetical protein